MIKRTLYFSNPTRLRLKDNQIEIEVFDPVKTATFPIEDIALVVLDNQQITISHALIQTLQENAVGIISCNNKHMPQSILLPLEGNSIHQERYKAQLKVGKPTTKQLWAQTVLAKIKNQASLLSQRKIDPGYLTSMNVKSGDTTNREAVASAFYWKRIFSEIPNFKRHQDGDSPNNFLNYGYSILRSTMARSIVMAGLLPVVGLFHSNRYNAFCLADDLMEPYRPFVDKVVCDIIKKFQIKELTKEIKIELLKIPALDLFIDDEKCQLMAATQHTAVSLTKCYSGEQRKILYPEL